MSSSVSPSTCATQGSGKGSTQAASNTTSSNLKNESSGTNSSTTQHQNTSNTSANQQEFSTFRIATFCNDKADSQIMHQHSSTEASIHHHTSRLATYIEDIDATLTCSGD
ncbi:hypothetical protein V8E51_002943 [Hyaloscypha variabilis]